MRALALLGGAALLAGCTHATVADAPDPNLPEPARPGLCDAAKATRWIGRPATPALVEEARRAAGATLARTLAPGQMMTMDYRADRLNVVTDEAGTVTAIRCG